MKDAKKWANRLARAALEGLFDQHIGALPIEEDVAVLFDNRNRGGLIEAVDLRGEVIATGAYETTRAVIVRGDVQAIMQELRTKYGPSPVTCC